MLVTFGLFICVQFISDPCIIQKFPDFYIEIPAFYADIFRFIFHCARNVHGRFLIFYICYVANYSSTEMCGRGERVGAHWCRICLHNCARKIILAHNLLHQAKSQYQVLVCLLFLNGDWEVDMCVSFRSMTSRL